LKKRKPPDEIRGTQEFKQFFTSLRKTSETFRRINSCLDILREDIAAGEKIEQTKFPEIYVRKYGITNLYRLTVDRGSRLVYTVIAEGPKKVVCVLEYFSTHKNYDKRFGYSS
jgi:hypothetical protein